MGNSITVREAFEKLDYGSALESATPVKEWLQSHQDFGLFINGAWSFPKGAKKFPTVNPASGETLAQITQARPADVEAAFKAAKKALPQWQKIGGAGRAKYLYAMARHIQKQARFFAVLETLDNGKPIRESRDIDIPLVARHFYHHAGWAQLFETQFSGYEPLGVVGQIIPWNFPLLMLAWKVAPALAMGNTVVLKPAEYTSLTALRFAQLCQEIGLPAGVVNIVTGDGEVGAQLVAHPEIAKIAFTGSTEVGKLIRRQTAGSGKKLSLELGGKSPFIVFDDADLDSSVEGVVDAIWFNQGQVCCAGSRLLVQESIAPVLIEKLKVRMEKLSVGDPLDKSVDIGAIVAPVQLAQIRKLVEQGAKEGAQCWQPKSFDPKNLATGGCYFPPTLFTEVSPSHTLSQVEIFGPVLVTTTFRTPAEAVRLANHTRYGLAASVWTENINLALDIAPQLKAGTVWINSTNLFDAASGFGGYRESGFGREGGREGLFEYLRPKGTYKAVAVKKAMKPAPATNSVLTAMANDGLDRTAKLFIGGKQVRPDGGYARAILNPRRALVGHVAEGNRKDLRNAVEAAHAAVAWERVSSHGRAQILFFIAENLAARRSEFIQRLQTQTGGSAANAAGEFEAAVNALMTWAAWADKYDGLVHHTPVRNVTLAMPEPMGVMAVSAGSAPLLDLVRPMAAAMATGNRLVLIPSTSAPLSATDFYQVLETSDVPAGVVNIVTGNQDELIQQLANHDDVDGLWHLGNVGVVKAIETAAAENLKRTWMVPKVVSQDEIWIREATQVKNIWVPYGE